MTNNDSLIKALVTMIDNFYAGIGARGPSAAESVGNLFDISVGDVHTSDFTERYMGLMQAMNSVIAKMSHVKPGSCDMSNTLEKLLDDMTGHDSLNDWDSMIDTLETFDKLLEGDD